MKSKLARLGTLSFEEKTMSFEMNSKADPLIELANNVRLLIWSSVVFAVIISTIAFTGLFVAWHGLRTQVERTEDLVIALCRQTNAHNQDLILIALQQGVPAHELTPLAAKPCTIVRLEEDFGK